MSLRKYASRLRFRRKHDRLSTQCSQHHRLQAWDKVLAFVFMRQKHRGSQEGTHMTDEIQGVLEKDIAGMYSVSDASFELANRALSSAGIDLRLVKA